MLNGYTDGRTKVKRILIVLFILFIIILIAFEMRKVITGPELTFKHDKFYAEYADNSFLIAGQTENVKDLYISDKKLLMDKQGNFKEKVLLYNGINNIQIKAYDRFNQETVETITIYH